MNRLLAATVPLTLAAGSVGLLGGTANAATTTPRTCPTGHLPAIVAGQPEALRAGAPTGDYLWHGSDWNLMVTHPGHAKVVFTGTIHASAPISFTRVRDEKDDVIALSADRRTLTFRFVDYGWLDGVTFRAGCAKVVSFTLQVDGHELPPQRAFLGSRDAHPTSVPFAVERR